MKKQLLVLLHSFPTNSIILKGLIEFLSDYFSVFFIDLPGFNNNKINEKATFELHVNYVEKEIKKLGVKNYWLGGISFGFLIANKINDDNCIGILAMEPFVNNSYLNFSKFKKVTFMVLINFSNFLNNFFSLLNNRIIEYILIHNWLGKEKTKIILQTMESKTFFETAVYIINYKKSLKFQDKPYILMINKNDKIIDANKTINYFKKHRNLLITYNTVEHHPKEITKKYFMENIKKQEISKILDFMNLQIKLPK